MDTGAKIGIQCDACTARMKVPADAVGRRVACPKCGARLTVTPPKTAPAAAVDRIDFHCPECTQHLKAPAAHAGKRIRCPKCQTAVAVPALAPAEAPVHAAAAPASDDLPFEDLLSAERAQTTVVADVPLAGAKRCPTCAAAAPIDAAICTVCGYDFRSGQRLPAPGAARAGPDEDAGPGLLGAARGIALGSLLCVVGAAIGAAVWYGVAIGTLKQYGFIAWGLGALTGGGMYLGLRASHPLGGLVSAGVAFGGIWAAKAAIFYTVLAPLFSALAPESVAEQREALTYDIAFETVGGPPDHVDMKSPEFEKALEDAQRDVALMTAEQVVERHEEERIIDWAMSEAAPSTFSVSSDRSGDNYDTLRNATRDKVKAMSKEEIKAKYGDKLHELREEFGSLRKEIEGSFWSIMFGPMDAIFMLLAVVTAYRVGAGGAGMNT